MKRVCTRIIVLTALGALQMPIVAVSQQTLSGDSQWYVGITTGTGLDASMQQAADHLGDVCSTTAACESLPGIRVNYYSGMMSGWSLAVNGGYQTGPIRLELAVARQSRVMDVSISGSPKHGNSYVDFAGNYTVIVSKMGMHNANSVLLGAYYVISRGKAAIYLGGGLGLTKSNVKDALFDATDQCFVGHSNCSQGPISPRVNLYADERDLSLSRHISAGLDQHVANQVLIGLKLTYSRFANAMQAVDYTLSPEMQLGRATFAGISDVSLAVSAKYLFRWKPLHVKR